jgi:hypothetical protein
LQTWIRNIWFDSGFFIQHLADGLIALRSVDPAMAPQITAELLNEANYAYTEVRDPADGMYWRNWRICRVNPRRLQQWNLYTGQNMDGIGLMPIAASERNFYVR